VLIFPTSPFHIHHRHQQDAVSYRVLIICTTFLALNTTNHIQEKKIHLKFTNIFFKRNKKYFKKIGGVYKIIQMNIFLFSSLSVVEWLTFFLLLKFCSILADFAVWRKKKFHFQYNRTKKNKFFLNDNEISKNAQENQILIIIVAYFWMNKFEIYYN
jgi:hypothetical protein